MGRKVGRKELAEIFDVTPTTISNWQSDGMPVAARFRGARGNQYDVEECTAWRSGRRLTGHRHAKVSHAPDGELSQDLDYNQERARLTHHQANIAELDAEARRGNLWPVETVAHMFQQIVGNARARLLAIPGKLRNRVPDMPPRAHALVEDLIREALDELAADQLSDDARRALERYHEHLASAAAPDSESVGDAARRDH